MLGTVPKARDTISGVALTARSIPSIWKDDREARSLVGHTALLRVRPPWCHCGRNLTEIRPRLITTPSSMA